MIAVLEDKVQHEGHSIQFYMCGGSLIHHSVVLTGNCSHMKKKQLLTIFQLQLHIVLMRKMFIRWLSEVISVKSKLCKIKL